MQRRHRSWPRALLDAGLRLFLAVLGAFIGLLAGVVVCMVLAPPVLPFPHLESVVRVAGLNLLAALVLAGFAVGIIAPMRVKPAGHCATCGYDLRGNTSRRCPECGEPVTSW